MVPTQEPAKVITSKLRSASLSGSERGLHLVRRDARRQPDVDAHVHAFLLDGRVRFLGVGEPQYFPAREVIALRHHAHDLGRPAVEAQDAADDTRVCPVALLPE